MKRLKTLSKILFLFFFTIVLSARNAGSTINGTLIIPYVEFGPIIDGVLDEDWNFPDIGMTVYVDNIVPAGGHEDLSALYRVAWNEDGFFLFGRVIDDSIKTDLPDPWDNDCWEIFIDGDNTKGAAYDENDVNWRWVYGINTDSAGWADRGKWVWVETYNGYDFELAIPAAELEKSENPLFALEEGTVIGWETQVTDNDTGTCDCTAKWWSSSDDAWVNPGVFGTAVLGNSDVSLEIPYVNSAPVIDGILDNSWTSNEVPEIAMSANTWQILPDGGDSDLSSFYRAAWNEDGFYFFGKTIDDSIYVDMDSVFWKQDHWEIYFDGGNEDSSSYDSNDVVWRWVYGTTEIEPFWADAGIWAWLETDDGYNFELSIPADSLVNEETPLFTLGEGTEIGFDVQVTDDDTGARDCITKWWCNNDDSWLNPGLFGTAILTREHSGISEQLVANNNIKLSVPAVLNSNTGITYTIRERSLVKLNLFNIAGQKVKNIVNKKQNAGTHNVSVDVSGLSNGVYFCRLDACDGTSTEKLMLIK
jgi:hypothetical protein